MRRLGWGVADQAVSSLGNLLLGVYVARSLGAAALGAVGLCLVVYAVVVNASRGLSTDPLMVRFGNATSAQWRPAVASSGGVAVLVGLAGGLGCLAAGAALHRFHQDEIGPALVALGVGLPGLILQDSWRYAFFSAGQGAKAFANDAVWSVLLLGALLIGEVTGAAGVAWAMLAFGGTATLTAVFGVLQSGIVPRPAKAPSWVRDHRDLCSRFVMENVILGAGAQVRLFIVAATVGLAAAGAIRGAEMLVGPIVALLMGVAQVAVPEAVRELAKGRAALRKICLVLSWGLAFFALAWGVVVLVVFPHGIGDAALGSIWASSFLLVPGVVVCSIAGCLHVGPSAGLRALARADRSLRAQVIATALNVGLGSLGALAWGAQGAVWGAALGLAGGAVIWWVQFGRGLAEHPATLHPASQVDPLIETRTTP